MLGALRIVILWSFFSFQTSAQTTVVTGKIVDAINFEELEGVKVIIEGTTHETISDKSGDFNFIPSDDLVGNQVLIFRKEGYDLLRISIIILPEESKDLDVLLLQPDVIREQLRLRTITLTDNELDEEEGKVENIAGLLQASRDVYLNAAAFDFSQTFFKPRGVDSEFGKVFINGIEMNKMFNGRPQWGNWGGLNDVQRNQVFTMASLPSEVGFGGIAGSTNIIMRAGKFSKGGRVSYAAANRSYTGRVMATYNSGELPSGWAYSLSASRRFAEEGYVEGTVYKANAVYASIEKRLGRNNSLNFTGFYTPVERGRSSANTDEVFRLKGIRYNSFWGIQDEEIRNSRIREIEEPVLMMNYYWDVDATSSINMNFSYQFGETSNSRIDFGGTRLVIDPAGGESFIGGGSNPDPSYYQKLPSYFLRNRFNSNFEAAYRAQQQFQENGQLDWKKLYLANHLSKESGGNSIYIIAEDVTQDSQLNANIIYSKTFNSKFKFINKISYSKLNSQNFSRVKDLLGGTGYLDVDFFAESDGENPPGDLAQSDLLNRNRIVEEGERFKYNFNLLADVLKLYSQFQFRSRRIDFYLAVFGSTTSYFREGLYKNGSFPNTSLGKSEKLNFINSGLKAGSTWRITGRHILDFNTAQYSKAPTLRNSFSNSRQNNDVVIDLQNELISSYDVNYVYRTTKFRTRITGYYIMFEDATEISFYYADGLSGLGRNSTTAFVQEVLTGIGKEHIGAEIGVDAQVTPTIKLKAAAGFGQYTYSTNPNLYLTSDDFEQPVNYGEAYLKNYRIPGGPQRAMQIGFEYRDPDYWWFGATVNFFSHAFLDVSPLTRTENFLKDSDGLPLLNYDEKAARILLKQEQFDSYFLVNAIGGKSWRINDYYLGFFISLNNIFDVLYKTGGFEQSRNANFRTLKEDRDRDQPVFGNKYWYGYGATYFANFYVRF